MEIKIVPLIIFAFVLGSIPFGVIITKAKGVDIRKVGSGNIGATNVLRSVGRWPALLTLLGDMLKGAIAVQIGKCFEIETFYEGVVGLAAIMGHNFSIFLKFKGGKGVATSMGVLSIYSLKIAVITFIIWLVVVLLTKYSSLGAILSFGVLPINILLFDDKRKLLVAILITVFILLRHKDNIYRLIKGTERKVGERNVKEGSAI